MSGEVKFTMAITAGIDTGFFCLEGEIAIVWTMCILRVKCVLEHSMQCACRSMIHIEGPELTK